MRFFCCFFLAPQTVGCEKFRYDPANFGLLNVVSLCADCFFFSLYRSIYHQSHAKTVEQNLVKDVQTVIMVAFSPHWAEKQRAVDEGEEEYIHITLEYIYTVYNPTKFK